MAPAPKPIASPAPSTPGPSDDADSASLQLPVTRVTGVTEEEVKRTLSSVTDTSTTLVWASPALALGWAKMRGHTQVTRSLPTAGVDQSGRLYLNPDFWDKLSPPERMFLLAHETLHTALCHSEMDRNLGIVQKTDDPRFAGADGWWIPPEEQFNKQLSNIAQDMVINHALKVVAETSNGWTMPPDGLLPPSEYDGPLDSETLYWWLKDKLRQVDKQIAKLVAMAKEMDQNNPTASPGKGCGTVQGPASGKNKGNQQQSKKGQGTGQEETDQDPPNESSSGSSPIGTPGLSKEQVSSMADEMRAMDRLVGAGSALGRILDVKHRARTDYRALLRAGMSEAQSESEGRTERTYSRAGRDAPLDPEVMLPGFVGTDPSLCVAIDTSGSMGEPQVKAAVKEVLKLCADFPYARVFLVTHSDEVGFAGWLKPGGSAKAICDACAYTGGTDPVPAYEAAKKVAPRKKFDAMIHLTDTFFPQQEWPPYPAKHLVVGLIGVGLDAGGTPIPRSAKKIPVKASV